VPSLSEQKLGFRFFSPIQPPKGEGLCKDFPFWGKKAKYGNCPIAFRQLLKHLCIEEA